MTEMGADLDEFAARVAAADSAAFECRLSCRCRHHLQLWCVLSGRQLRLLMTLQ
jgi:hypothetical protein